MYNIKDKNFYRKFASNLVNTIEPIPEKVIILYENGREMIANMIFESYKNVCDVLKVKFSRQVYLPEAEVIIPLVDRRKISQNLYDKLLNTYSLIHVTLPNSIKSGAFISPIKIKDFAKIIQSKLTSAQRLEVEIFGYKCKIEINSSLFFDFDYSKTKIANFPSGEVYWKRVHVKGDFIFETTPRQIEWYQKKKRFLGEEVDEFGIGINPYASPEGSWREIEKLAGSVHIGVSEAGKHLDLICTKPLLTTQQKILIKDGKFTLNIPSRNASKFQKFFFRYRREMAKI